MASGYDAFPPLWSWIEQYVDVTVVYIVGEVDMATEPDLSKAVLDALDGSSSLVVADLAEVTFFGAAGLEVLVCAHEIAERRQRRFRVVLGAGAVRRAIQVAGLEQILAVHDTLEDALNGGIVARGRTGRDA